MTDITKIDWKSIKATLTEIRAITTYLIDHHEAPGKVKDSSFMSFWGTYTILPVHINTKKENIEAHESLRQFLLVNEPRKKQPRNSPGNTIIKTISDFEAFTVYFDEAICKRGPQTKQNANAAKTTDTTPVRRSARLQAKEQAQKEKLAPYNNLIEFLDQQKTDCLLYIDFVSFLVDYEKELLRNYNRDSDTNKNLREGTLPTVPKSEFETFLSQTIEDLINTSLSNTSLNSAKQLKLASFFSNASLKNNSFKSFKSLVDTYNNVKKPNGIFNTSAQLQPTLKNLIVEALEDIKEDAQAQWDEIKYNHTPLLNRQYIQDTFKSFHKGYVSNLDDNFDKYDYETYKDVYNVELSQLLYAHEGFDQNIKNTDKNVIKCPLKINMPESTNIVTKTVEEYKKLLKEISENAECLTNQFKTVTIFTGKKYIIGRYGQVWNNLYEGSQISPTKLCTAFNDHFGKVSPSDLESILIPAFLSDYKWTVSAKHLQLDFKKNEGKFLVSGGQQDIRNPIALKLYNRNETLMLTSEKDYSETYELCHNDEIIMTPENAKICTYKVIGSSDMKIRLKYVEEPITIKEYNDLLINNNLSSFTIRTTTSGGAAKQKVSYKGRKYTVRTGKRGGSYILVNDKKIYL